MEKFIQEYAKLIVDNPSDVSVSVKDTGEHYREVSIFTNKSDVGRIIGIKGKLISSIKNVVLGACTNNNIKYKIVVKSI